MLDKMLSIEGILISLTIPLAMGILDITPNSFYVGGRKQIETAIKGRIREISPEREDWTDIGGYSSRPDAAKVTPEEGICRSKLTLHISSKYHPDIPVSVDTFRAGVARHCVEGYGVTVTNDISGGELDADILQMVADLEVPYIMIHTRGTPQTMQRHVDYPDMMEEITLYFSRKVRQPRSLGVSDIILDPGSGFGKTLEQNYQLMSHLKEFFISELPLLAGVSRKSIIYKLLGGIPVDSSNGMIILSTYVLLNGANTLHVHNVREVVETIRVVGQMTNE